MAGQHAADTPTLPIELRMSGWMHVRTHHPHLGVSVVAVAGDIDRHTRPLLAQALLPGLAQAERIIVDLHEVDFLGLAGVDLLLLADRLATHHGAQLWLAASPPALRRVLHVAGVLPRLRLAPTVAAALPTPRRATRPRPSRSLAPTARGVGSPTTTTTEGIAMTAPDPDELPVDPNAEDADNLPDDIDDVADADPADVADQRRSAPPREHGDRG